MRGHLREIATLDRFLKPPHLKYFIDDLLQLRKESTDLNQKDLYFVLRFLLSCKYAPRGDEEKWVLKAPSVVVTQVLQNHSEAQGKFLQCKLISTSLLQRDFPRFLESSAFFRFVDDCTKQLLQELLELKVPTSVLVKLGLLTEEKQSHEQDISTPHSGSRSFLPFQKKKHFHKHKQNSGLKKATYEASTRLGGVPLSDIEDLVVVAANQEVYSSEVPFKFNCTAGRSLTMNTEEGCLMCHICEKKVYTVSNLQELKYHSDLNHCVQVSSQVRPPSPRIRLRLLTLHETMTKVFGEEGNVISAMLKRPTDQLILSNHVPNIAYS